MAPLILPGCLLVPRAKDRFEKQFVCPEARLVAHERTDLKAHDFVCMERATGASRVPGWGFHPLAAYVDCALPPPEIQGDPGRLGFWRERRDRRFQDFDADVGPIIEVEGCGVRRFYARYDDLGGADPRGER